MNNLEVIENELVPVYVTSTGEKVVNGRELWRILESRQDFTTWVKKRLSDCDAEENLDYTCFHEKMEANNATMTEYIIKLDTAKEMAMLERNDVGKRVRKYFIEVENRYKQSVVDRSQLSPNLQALSMIIDSMTKQELDLKHQQEQIAKLEQTQEVIKEAVTPVIDNWREDIVRKIRKIQSSNGADFKSLNTEMYKELERRAGCDLNTRLRNKQQRMYEMGCTKTSINGVRKIDIIDEDKKLREIYGKIVSEYVIRYCA